VVLVVFHLALLHDSGSNNPLGVSSSQDKINFYPYFLIKDVFTFLIIIFFYFIFVFYFPDVLGHSDNYIEANPLSTPAHIVPE
jgi:quinol-cytochrome oxidoreductase complex cytochrome b subunit